MPNRKRKTKARIKGEGSDDESVIDNASTITALSDNRSVEGSPLEEEEASQEELYEEKLKETFDELTVKSTQTRVNALKMLAKALSTKILPDLISDRRMSLADAIEKCLKKGRKDEQELAAHLAMITCFQIDDMAMEIKKNIGPLLTLQAKDVTVTSKVRAKCCSALALIHFISEDDGESIAHPMQCLEGIFSGSYLKGDGVSPILTAEEQYLHATALSAWSLLLTLVSPYDVYFLMSSSENNSNQRYLPRITKLMELLKSSSLEVRIAAGEAICVAFEIGRIHDEDFECDIIDELCYLFMDLSKESKKSINKKDRKTQRANFREILHYFENETFSEEQIKFGQENLMLDSWCRKIQYDAICSVLGSGMNSHLLDNTLLRDIFELGVRKCPTNADLKISKHDRHLANAAAFKYRTITRGKNRDKRAVVITSF